VSGSDISWDIYKSATCSRQITTPAPHRSVFLQTGCPSCCPTNSVKALKAQWHNLGITALILEKKERTDRKKTPDCYHPLSAMTRPTKQRKTVEELTERNA